MKLYPSIDYYSKILEKHEGEQCYVFVKSDGSNLRFEWTKKRGWHKFGTRNHLFDETHIVFGSAIPLFKERYGSALEQVFKNSKVFRGVDEVTVFAEWFGAKSFAGHHLPNDPKTLILFDVNPNKKGFLGPKQFLDEFGHLEVAELLGVENVTEDLKQAVRSGEYDCRSKLVIRNDDPEGVICKGGLFPHKGWMAKIKTENYYNLLKERHPEDWMALWE